MATTVPGSVRRAGLLLGAVAAMTTLPALAATFRVGGDAACSFNCAQSPNCLQLALTAATQSPGPDTIRIARNHSYSNVALSISNQDLTVFGGYANCGQEQNDGQPTTLSGGTSSSIVTIAGNGNVVLFWLNLNGGTGGAGYGGALNITGGPHEVRLFGVNIIANSATHGGGISVRSGDALASRLIIQGNTLIASNTASGNGGGIYCANSAVDMTDLDSGIAGNTGVEGGGLRAENCTVRVATPGVFGAAFANNVATANGGGINITGERSLLRIYTKVTNQATTFVGNEAGNDGGGIAVGSSARVEAWETNFEGNLARNRGGAISVYDGDDDPSAHFTLRRTPLPTGLDAVNCAAGIACNLIANNRALSASNQPRPGAAVYVRGNPGTFDFAAPTAFLYETTVRGNSGSSLAQSDFNGGGNQFDGPGIVFENSLIVGNTSSAALFHGADNSYLELSASTIARNTVGGNFVIYRNGTHEGNFLRLATSIIDQPEDVVLDSNGNHGAYAVDYLLVRNTTGFPSNPTVAVGPPSFLNPAGGDYRLHPQSVAVDFAPPWPQDAPLRHDLILAERPRDLPLTDNVWGAQDLGAYETQNNDHIFYNGFQTP